MKTRYQKVICILACVFLIASFFAVPVYALDEYTIISIQNIIYDYGMGAGGNYDPDFRPYTNLYGYEYLSNYTSFSVLNSRTSSNGLSPSDILTDDDFMLYNFSDVFTPSYRKFYFIYYINQIFDDTVVRQFESGDTFYLDVGTFEFWPYGGDVLRYRFTLRDAGDDFSFSFGNVVAYTDVIEHLITEDDGVVDYNALKFTFRETVSSNTLCLCLEFDVDIHIFSELQFDIPLTNFDLFFGSGVSPNYPIYPSAPGGDSVSGLGSAEHELIGTQQQGINTGLSVMGDTSSVLSDLNASLQLGAFTTQLSGILDRVVSIPGIDALVQVSLALGLFASLMALSASIVSAADRKAGLAKREANRDKKK